MFASFHYNPQARDQEDNQYYLSLSKDTCNLGKVQKTPEKEQAFYLVCNEQGSILTLKNTRYKAARIAPQLVSLPGLEGEIMP